MTDQIAVFLGAAIITAIVGDMYFYDSAHLVFLGREFLELTEWIAFWR